MVSTKPISIWLLPDEADNVGLTETVDRLALAHNAPTFEPHVTLISGKLDEQATREAFVACSDQCAAVTSEVVSTGHSEALFQTLFYRFSLQDFQPLKRVTEKHLSYSDYTLNPHLSLLYKLLPAATRQDLAETHDASGQTLTFNRLALHTPAEGETDFANISKWRTEQVLELQPAL